MAKKPRKRNFGDFGPDPAKMGFGDVGGNHIVETNWSPSDEEKCVMKFQEIRRDLVLFEPFYAVLAMRMSPRIATEWEARRIKICATNGFDLLLNPSGFLSLTRPEQIGVVCKSVLHAALKHLLRRGTRNLLVWNVSCDISTTRIILDDQKEVGKKSEMMTLPDWVIYDHDKQFAGLDTEAIYQRLADEIRQHMQGGLSSESTSCPQPSDSQGQQDQQDLQEQNGEGSGSGQGQSQSGSGQGQSPSDSSQGSSSSIEEDYQKMAEFLNERNLGQALVGESFIPTHDEDGNEINPQAQERHMNQIEAAWKSTLEQAIYASKSSGQGHIPAGLQDLLRRAERPRLPWKRLLREYINQKARGGYSWSQPNRRHIARGLYLPSNQDMALGRVIVVCDTSGSVPDHMIQQFLAEANDIHDQYRCQIDIVNCDAAVGRDEKSALIGRYRSTERIPKTLTITGRGGTDFRPAFEWANDHIRPGSEAEDIPAVLVYMTDGMGDYPKKAPRGYPVIWVLTQEFPEGHHYYPPFGQIVYALDENPNF